MQITHSHIHIFSVHSPLDTSIHSDEETVARIIKLTENLNIFWKSADGWASVEVAAILSRSRLDWQVSLAKQLKLFLDPQNAEEPGLIILAWTTLGSLLEGLLKLFLSVYHKDYHSDSKRYDAKSITNKKGNIIDPEDLRLDKLRIIFADRIFPDWTKEEWEKRGEIHWLEWMLKIQQRRNAIHSFKDRDIGTIAEFNADLKRYLHFMRKLNYALPYPEDMYRPREV